MKYRNRQKKTRKDKEIVFFSFDEPDTRSLNFTTLLKEYEQKHPGKMIVRQKLDNGCNNIFLLQYGTSPTDPVKLRRLNIEDIRKICMSLAECQYRQDVSDITHVGVPETFVYEYLEGDISEFADVNEFHFNEVKVQDNSDNALLFIFSALVVLFLMISVLITRGRDGFSMIKEQ